MDRYEKAATTRIAKDLAQYGVVHIVYNEEQIEYLTAKLRQYTDRVPIITPFGSINGKPVVKIELQWKRN